MAKRINLLIIFACLYFINTFAQVGINTLDINPLVELEIENISDGNNIIPKGIMIPRMTESQRDLMQIDENSDANSLMVYNTDEDCYNYYSKTEKQWVSLCGTLGKAVFSIDVESIKAHGDYSSATPLTSENYVSLTITVTKPGSYNINVIPAIDEGFYFSTDGEFLKAGTYTIIVPGYGTPNTPTPKDEKGVQMITRVTNVEISRELYIFIHDSTMRSDFTLSCLTAKVNGTYTIGTPLTGSNTITLTLTSTTESIGSPYHIQTTTVNGYSFKGDGVLTGGTQQITLTASGTPISNGTDEFIIQTNSTIEGGSSCYAEVKVATRKIRIIGAAGSDTSYNIGLSGNFLNQVLLNKNYFGLNQESIFPVNGFEFRTVTDYTVGAVANLITSFNPDIIFVQYNWYMAATNNTDFDAIVNFVNNGGVLIYCSDGAAATEVRNVAAQRLARAIFENTTMTVNAVDGTDAIYNTRTIQNTRTLVTDGPFYSLDGLSMGRDNYANFSFSFSGFPFDTGKIIAFNSTANNAIFAFMHSTKGFAMFCDGAPFAATDSTANWPYNWPAKFSTSGGVTIAIPNIYSTPFTYNSFLFLNLMAWAIDYAQKNKN